MKYTITDRQDESQVMPDTFESKVFDGEEAIQFPNSYTDALVVKAIINGDEVHRILVDTGSSVNAIFHHQAEEMGFSLDNYEYSSRILQGFNGEKCRPEGEITLPVYWGEETNYLTHNVRFVILNSKSPYNCIFGRPLLNQFDAFVSTKRMMVKIPAPYGIATIRANIPEARQCYVNSWNSHQLSKMVKPLAPMKIKNRLGSTQTVELSPSCSLSYIVGLLKQRGLYEKPCILKAPYKQNNSEAYCKFHEQRGHETQQCYKLKELIRRLIAEGHLHEFLNREDKSFEKASTSTTKRRKRAYDWKHRAV